MRISLFTMYFMRISNEFLDESLDDDSKFSPIDSSYVVINYLYDGKKTPHMVLLLMIL